MVGFATDRHDGWEESALFFVTGKKFALNTDLRNSGDYWRGEKD